MRSIFQSNIKRAGAFTNVSEEEVFRKQLASHLLKAFDLIAEAHNKNLFYPEDYYARYDWTSQERGQQALTHLKKMSANPKFALDSPALTTLRKYFEYECDHRGQPIAMTYRLRERVSASSALKILLHQGETLIDCQGAVQLARYMTLLSLLQEKYGLKPGALYFDALFGSVGKETFRSQRLLIGSIHPLLCLARNNNFDYRLIPMCSLAYFLRNVGGVTSVDGTDVTHIGDRKLLPGSQIGFLNVGLYLRRHTILGSSPSTNVCYQGKDESGKDIFRGLDAPTPLRETEIIEKLYTYLSKPPDAFVEYFVKNNTEYYHMWENSDTERGLRNELKQLREVSERLERDYRTLKQLKIQLKAYKKSTNFECSQRSFELSGICKKIYGNLTEKETYLTPNEIASFVPEIGLKLRKKRQDIHRQMKLVLAKLRYSEYQELKTLTLSVNSALSINIKKILALHGFQPDSKSDFNISSLKRLLDDPRACIHALSQWIREEEKNVYDTRSHHSLPLTLDEFYDIFQPLPDDPLSTTNITAMQIADKTLVANVSGTNKASYSSVSSPRYI